MLALAPLVAPFLSLVLGQTPGTAPQAPGAATMTTTRVDILRLSYAYPATFVDATSMVGPAFEATVGQDAAAAPIARCLSLPFSRMQPGSKEIGMVLLVRADAACFKRKFNAGSVAELARGEAQGLSAAGAKTNMAAPVNFSVAGRPASLVQGNFTLPTGQTLQSMVVCVLDQPDIACWQFLSNSAAGLSSMSAFPVTFDGAPPAPLVTPEAVTAH